MSSVHLKDKSKYWFCNYQDAVTGKQKFVSTKTTNKAEAERICEGIEQNSKEAAKNLTPQAAGKLIDELIKITRKAVTGKLTVAEGEKFIALLRKSTKQAGQ